MDANERKEALEYVLSQIECGYVDLGSHDKNAIDVVNEALKIYKTLVCDSIKVGHGE